MFESARLFAVFVTVTIIAHFQIRARSDPREPQKEITLAIDKTGLTICLLQQPQSGDRISSSFIVHR